MYTLMKPAGGNMGGVSECFWLVDVYRNGFFLIELHFLNAANE